MSVHDAPAPAMIGKVVAVLHKPRKDTERLYVGRLAAYIRLDDQIKIWFVGMEDRHIAVLDIQQDTFSFQSFDTKE